MSESQNRKDEPRLEIRAGEALPQASLTNFLRTTLGPSLDEIEIAQFPAGYSNLTYLVRWGGRDYVLRRPPLGNRVKSAHDMSREYRVLSALHPSYSAAPTPIAYSDDESIIGAPFYLMERVHGIVLRRDNSEFLSSHESTLNGLCDRFALQFARLHSLDFKSIGLRDFGRPTGYTQRQVQGWTRRFADAATEPTPTIENLAAWLADHCPSTSREALIHNDFKFDNLVLAPQDPTQILAVLDWEMATLGDPLMDLGSTLAYWVQPDDTNEFRAWSFGPTDLPGAFTRRQLVDKYLQYAQPEEAPSNTELIFYYGYGLFKLAGIVQQIYARYVRGLTRDERFANLNQMVKAIGHHASQVIARGEI